MVDVIVTDGLWHKVIADRNGAVGTLTVDGITRNVRAPAGASILNVDGSIYIGKLHLSLIKIL